MACNFIVKESCTQVLNLVMHPSSIMFMIPSCHIILCYRIVFVNGELYVVKSDPKEELHQESGVDPEPETVYSEHQGKPRFH